MRLTLAEQVRAQDPARYLAALYAPASARPALFALLLFNSALAQVRVQAREPLLAEMRLAWWRETIEALYAGRPRAHDVVQAMHATGVAARVPQPLLLAMIESRHLEALGEPPATLALLEAHVAEGAGSLAEAGCHLLFARPDAAAIAAARRAAEGWALAAMAASVAVHARQGWRFVPDELLQDSGIAPASALDQGADQRWVPAIARMAQAASQRLGRPQKISRPLPPMLGLAVLARACLKRLDREGHDPSRLCPLVPGPATQAALFWAMLQGRC